MRRLLQRGVLLIDLEQTMTERKTSNKGNQDAPRAIPRATVNGRGNGIRPSKKKLLRCLRKVIVLNLTLTLILAVTLSVIAPILTLTPVLPVTLSLIASLVLNPNGKRTGICSQEGAEESR